MKNNRKKGRKWEYDVRNFLQPFYNKKIITTAQGSRLKDANKEDLMFEDGNSLDFPSQCKNTISFNWFWLDEIPANGIIFWKRMVKVNTKQKCLGKYVIMNMETFEQLMKKCV